MSSSLFETMPAPVEVARPFSPARAEAEQLLAGGELEKGVQALRAVAMGEEGELEDILRLAEIYINVGLCSVAAELLESVRQINRNSFELNRLSSRLKTPTLFRTEWQLRPDNGRLVTRQDVENFFARHYNIKDWYFGAHFNRLVETLMRSAAYITADSSVLEVGSNGSFPLLLWKLFGIKKISAADGLGGFFGYKDGQIIRGEVPGLELALPIAKVDLERDHWPYADESQDVLLCYETLEHFREDPMHFMIEANRVLKPNGVLILTTPNSSSLKAAVNILNQYTPYLYSVYVRGRNWPGMAHIKEYAVREMQQLYQHAGFTVDSHQTFSPYKDDVDNRVPEIKAALLRLGLQEPLSGSTHFIVGRKTSAPTCRAFKPLYQENEPWTGTLTK